MGWADRCHRVSSSGLGAGVFSPLKDGGLGVHKLSTCNKVLQGKWLWRLELRGTKFGGVLLVYIME
jgi:hypothetical protein